MNNSKSKRTLKENLAMLVRGYKIVFRIYPKYIIWEIINSIANTATPYFSIYMTSLIINELVSDRNIERLLWLAGITVSGVFIISSAQASSLASLFFFFRILIKYSVSFRHF